MSTLVGWNGNTASHTALDWAITREYLLDRHVILCHVSNDAVSDMGTLAALEHFADTLEHERSGLRFTAELLHGDPVAQLERRCSDGTLLVVGTDTRNEHPRRFERSLGMKLALRGTIGLVIVPIDARRGAAGIVVGVDGSPASYAALAVAADEASAREEALTVVRAWALRPVDEDCGRPYAQQVSAETARQRCDLERHLDPVRRRHPELRLELRFVHGPTVAGLLGTARSAGLLVLGADDPGRPLGTRVDHAAIMAMHVPVAIIPAHTSPAATSIDSRPEHVPVG